ncbi:MAG: 50S ribosomal protein L24 [Pseudomonadota bacterium]
MKKIRKGDTVIIVSGKDKGKQGTVLRSFPDSSKVLISGINLVKKHVKPNPLKGTEGGLVSKEMPINASNVALYDSKNQQIVRVRFLLEDGKKVRVSKSPSTQIEQ